MFEFETISATTSATLLILFVAYLIRGIAGFGSGLIAIPLLSISHPLTTVVPLVIILDILGSLVQSTSNRSKIRWDELIILLPFTIVGCLLALFLFKNIDLAKLNFSLAIFIIFFAIYQILPMPELRGTRIWSLPAGFLGGLIGTLFGTGGPLYMIYLSLRGLHKDEIRASYATYFFVDGSIRIAGFTAVGFLSWQLLGYLFVWMPAAAIGLFVGGRVHTGISNQTFKYMISLILVYSGYRLLNS